MQKTISDLKTVSSPGPDGIPSTVIKSAAPYICHILSFIVNLSFSTGIFSENLKEAKVIPIYKDGDKSNFTNYRPISVLNTFSKIFEKIINNRLNNYLA